MVQKYQIPASKSSAAESFSVETVVKSLANNKHNESTTTYYLLFKKWVNSLVKFSEDEIRSKIESLVTLTPQNYEKIVFKLKNQLE